jgi:hypothetical protein
MKRSNRLLGIPELVKVIKDASFVEDNAWAFGPALEAQAIHSIILNNKWWLTELYKPCPHTDIDLGGYGVTNIFAHACGQCMENIMRNIPE